jgi:hypothetical protein
MTELDALVPLGRRGLIQTTNLTITILVASLAIIKMGKTWKVYWSNQHIKSY